jgi:hypothetical protein
MSGKSHTYTHGSPRLGAPQAQGQAAQSAVPTQQQQAPVYAFKAMPPSHAAPYGGGGGGGGGAASQSQLQSQSQPQTSPRVASFSLQQGISLAAMPVKPSRPQQPLEDETGGGGAMQQLQHLHQQHGGSSNTLNTLVEPVLLPPPVKVLRPMASYTDRDRRNSAGSAGGDKGGDKSNSSGRGSGSGSGGSPSKKSIRFDPVVSINAAGKVTAVV